MKRYASAGIAIVLVTLLLASLAGARQDIKNSKHDLSYAVTGTYKASTSDPIQGGTTQICVFCHTPHGSNTFAPLWNRTHSLATYVTYTSDVLLGLGYWAAEDPLSGGTHVKTAICLSCHDGTIALGSVANMPSDIPSSKLEIAMRTSKIASASAGYIGTDLSDDHPVAIKYDNSALTGDTELKLPPLAGSIKLYTMASGRAAPSNPQANGDFVECTSCHNPHDNEFGKFLVETNQNSQLCMRCHDNKQGFSGSVHDDPVKAAADYAPPTDAPPAAGPQNHGPKVGDVKCMNCHFPHKAGLSDMSQLPQANPNLTARAGYYLLAFQEENTCFNTTNRWGQSSNVCHDSGATAQLGKDIKSEFGRSSTHQYASGAGTHRATEHGTGNTNYGWLSGTTNWHVQCADCHNSHSAGKVNHTPGTNVIGATSPLYGAGGVSVNQSLGKWPTVLQSHFNAFESLGVADSTSMPASYYEYQICFKCHSSFAWGGGTPPTSPSLGGASVMTDQAVEFSVGNTAANGGSMHPIEAATGHVVGTLTTSPTNWQTNQGSQTMYCSDCHAADAGTIAGPHGSNSSVGGSPPSNTPGFILVSSYTDTYGARGTTATQTTTDLCFKCHDAAVYQPAVPTAGLTGGTGFRVTGTNLNLHSQHGWKEIAANTTTPTPYPYRCVNCHTRVPHGWKRQGLVVFQGDGFPYEISNNAGLIYNTSVLPAPGAYNAAKGGDCNTANGCHQGP